MAHTFVGTEFILGRTAVGANSDKAGAPVEIDVADIVSAGGAAFDASANSQAILAVLMANSYADDTAATAGGLTTGDVYFNTTSNTFVAHA